MTMFEQPTAIAIEAIKCPKWPKMAKNSHTNNTLCAFIHGHDDYPPKDY